MNLSSMRYLEDPYAPPSEGPPDSGEMGWPEVSKGLFGVLSGYLLSILNGVAGVALLWSVTMGFRRPTAEIKGDDLTVLLVGGGVLFFSSLYSSYLLLRGKWRCMMNAPERRSARWLMFASMLCIFAGPAINLASGFVSVPRPKVRAPDQEGRPSVTKAAALYAEQLREAELSAYMRLTGTIIAPFGPIFFVLFLRALHACMGNALSARFTELYLLFVVLLAVATLSLLFDARVHIRADLLLCLGVGWLLSGVWYFLLIVGTAFSITSHLNAPRVQAGR